MHRGRFGVSALALFCFTAACGPSPEQLEAQRVLRSIDNLRNAPSEPLEARLELIKKLEHEPVQSEEAKTARDACVKAYTHLVQGQLLKRKVSEALKNPAQLGQDTVRDLGEAETQIKRSIELMPECSEATFQLRRPKKR